MALRVRNGLWKWILKRAKQLLKLRISPVVFLIFFALHFTFLAWICLPFELKKHFWHLSLWIFLRSGKAVAKLGCNPLLAAAKKVTIWRFYCIEDSCQLGPSVVAWLALPSSTTSFTCLQSKEIQQGAQAKGSVGFLTSPLMALHSSTSPRTALQSKPNVETRCRHTPEHQSNKPTLEYLCNKITCLLRSRENVVFWDIKCRLTRCKM